MRRAEVDRRIDEIGVVRTGCERHVAAILFTYRCTIACRHCCFNCGPGRAHVVMSPERCASYLEDLHELGRVIHIAGGEPMMYWHALRACITTAERRGAQPHFVETNCSFAVSDRIARQRLGFLKDHGLRGVLLSADPFHQRFVPPERFLRARAIACELFGEQNVWCDRSPDARIREYAQIARDEARLRAYVREHAPMLVGAAQRNLAGFLEPYPLDQVPLDSGWKQRYQARDCAIDFDRDTIWEVHIDPFDNLQTNCNVLLGNAQRTPAARLFADGPGNANFISRLLVEGGPFALAQFARDRHGFSPPQTIHQKCELCELTRRFLRPLYPGILAVPG